MTEENKQELPFRGVAVFMGGKEYIVPSLSTRQFRDNYKTLTQSIDGDTEQAVLGSFERFIPLIGLALRRNYPEMNDDQLWDLIDLSTFKTIVGAIQAASGMKTVAPGE